jgi:hypothetical protein
MSELYRTTHFARVVTCQLTSMISHVIGLTLHLKTSGFVKDATKQKKTIGHVITFWEILLKHAYFVESPLVTMLYAKDFPQILLQHNGVSIVVDIKVIIVM